MPKKLERELKARARRRGLKGKARDRYVYGTLRKTGWKPSREKDHERRNGMRKKVLGLCLAFLLLPGLLWAETTVPTDTKIRKDITNSPAGMLGKYKLYGTIPATLERLTAPEDTDISSYDTVRKWVPWCVLGSDTIGYQAQFVKVEVIATSGGTVNVVGYGPGIGTSIVNYSIVPISNSSEYLPTYVTYSTPIDSLWIWCDSGTAEVLVWSF